MTQSPITQNRSEPPLHVFWAGRSITMQPMAAVHAHSQVELNLMLAGAATYLFGGLEIETRAGEFLLFWGAVPHRTIAVAPATRFVCLYVPIEMFLALPLSAGLRETVLGGGLIAASDRIEADWPLRLHRELMSGNADLAELDRLEIELRLRRLDVTGWTNRAASHPATPGGDGRHAKVCAMAQFLTSHATGRISADQVAGAVGLHPNYAMSLFKNALGMTIGEYLTRYRLHLAQSMLLGGTRDVASIAFESGFGSVSRFHDAFRRRFGISPHRYRRASRPDRSAGDPLPP